MISKYEKQIINKLIDKYENSKSFIGKNKVNQKFMVKIDRLFPRYNDHSNYDVFQGVNEAVDVLVRKSYVLAKKNAANIYNSLILNVDKLEEIYNYVDRVPKRDINRAVIKLLEKYEDGNDILKKYSAAQYERIDSNKSIEFFNDDLEELEFILIAVDQLLKVETETFVRDFSVRIFKDSKTFEKISNKVVSLVFHYGDFPEREQLLGNLNIIKNPTYVNFKGAGSITIKGQAINLTNLNGDIAISSTMIKDIDEVNVTGKAVITIENLTSFHTYDDKDMFAIYLGGYHNRVRGEFIKKIHKQNPMTSFYHFGDIDAGGFYILEHLRNETAVNFIPYKMDIETLKRYDKYTKRLTDNDKKRLERLLDSKYKTVINYMLEHDCKLEQEAIFS